MWRGGLAVSRKNRGSHTARSGQEPHTTGGTKVALSPLSQENRGSKKDSSQSSRSPRTFLVDLEPTVRAAVPPERQISGHGHYTIGKEIGYLTLDIQDVAPAPVAVYIVPAPAVPALLMRPWMRTWRSHQSCMQHHLLFFIALAPIVGAAPVPVVEDIAPALAVSYAAPAPVGVRYTHTCR